MPLTCEFAAGPAETASRPVRFVESLSPVLHRRRGLSAASLLDQGTEPVRSRILGDVGPKPPVHPPRTTPPSGRLRRYSAGATTELLTLSPEATLRIGTAITVPTSADDRHTG
jgi:hypothetical protein